MPPGVVTVRVLAVLVGSVTSKPLVLASVLAETQLAQPVAQLPPPAISNAPERAATSATDWLWRLTVYHMPVSTPKPTIATRTGTSTAKIAAIAPRLSLRSRRSNLQGSVIRCGLPWPSSEWRDLALRSWRITGIALCHPGRGVWGAGRAGHAGGFVARQAVGGRKEKPNRHAQRAGNVVEPAGRDTAGATFVFVGLLEGNTDLPRQRLQSDTLVHATRANAGSDLLVDQLDRLIVHAVSLGRRARRSAKTFVQAVGLAPLMIRSACRQHRRGGPRKRARRAWSSAASSQRTVDFPRSPRRQDRCAQ